LLKWGGESKASSLLRLRFSIPSRRIAARLEGLDFKKEKSVTDSSYKHAGMTKTISIKKAPHGGAFFNTEAKGCTRCLNTYY